MRFIPWLYEQLDLGTDVSKFAKLCWDDINNGCASSRFSTQELVEHFSIKHKDKSEALTELLFTAFLEYTRETKYKL